MRNKGLITRVPWADAFTRREPLAPRPDSEPLHHLDRLAGEEELPDQFEVVGAFTASESDQVVANRFTEQRRGQVSEDDAWHRRQAHLLCRHDARGGRLFHP
jgi:hypothetical protein